MLVQGGKLALPRGLPASPVPAAEVRWMPGYFWSRGGAAAGQCYWGKGVCFSPPFLQARRLNKRKFFPLMFFDFCASVSTCLWWEPVGICHSWHLAPGLLAVCVLSCSLAGSGLPTLGFAALDWPANIQRSSKARLGPARGWLAVWQ